jgi:phage gp46-like protein
MDIALLFTEKGDFDVIIEENDLLGDLSPITPVTISFFTDRAAGPYDRLPDERPGFEGNRRGWFGDLTREGGRSSPIGSKLWLLSREKELPETVEKAREYASASLAWIGEEKGEYEIDARDLGGGKLKISGKVKLKEALGDYSSFSVVWDVNESYKVVILRGI